MGLSAAAAVSAGSVTAYAPTIAHAAEENAEAASNETQKLITLNGQKLPASMALPEPIAEDEIIETLDCDVLVIGAGISGCPAAAIAAEKGANVICVEKGGAICVTRPTGMSWFGTKKLQEVGVLCTEE